MQTPAESCTCAARSDNDCTCGYTTPAPTVLARVNLKCSAVMVEHGSPEHVAALRDAFFVGAEYVGLEYLSDGTVRVVPADQY
ncbi:MAG: hypothetical protein NVS3B25_18970 [Hymenobacter sp.]